MRRKANILRHQGTAVQFSRQNLLVCQAPYSAPCSTLPSCPSYRACPRSGDQAGFPVPLLYTTFPCRSNNALRCDGKCSALRRPTQHAAMTFAPRCDFCRTSLPDGKESDRYLPQPLSTLQETAFTDKQEATSRLKQSLSQNRSKTFQRQKQSLSKTEAKPFPNNRDIIPRHAKSPPPDMGEGLLLPNIYIPAAAHELSICNCMPEIKTGQSSPFAPPRQKPESNKSPLSSRHGKSPFLQSRLWHLARRLPGLHSASAGQTTHRCRLPVRCSARPAHR